jgi:hypothetical protein
MWSVVVGVRDVSAVAPMGGEGAVPTRAAGAAAWGAGVVQHRPRSGRRSQNSSTTGRRPRYLPWSFGGDEERDADLASSRAQVSRVFLVQAAARPAPPQIETSLPLRCPALPQDVDGATVIAEPNVCQSAEPRVCQASFQGLGPNGDRAEDRRPGVVPMTLDPFEVSGGGVARGLGERRHSPVGPLRPVTRRGAIGPARQAGDAGGRARSA